MSDMKYGVSVEFQKGIEALSRFRKAVEKFDGGREKALRSQISLLEKMNKLQGKVSTPKISTPVTKPPVKQPKAVKQPKRDPAPKASTTELAKRLKSEEVAYTKTQKALTVRLDKEEKERTRRSVAEVKARLKQEQAIRKQEASRVKQAVGKITAPTGAGDMKDYYSKLEKESLQTQRKKTQELHSQEKAQARVAAQLKRAKISALDSVMLTKKHAELVDRTAQASVRKEIVDAKSLKSVRAILRAERQRLNTMKKQSYVMNRMNASSKEMMGNMVSAFAVAAGGAYITTAGQDLESVSNTMLSVSEDAKEAKENLAFVENEAFSLGLSLTEASRGFAKMVSAKGEMSLEDTKESFKGVAQMSTLMGLSSEQSGRAINALQQMMSKGVVTAEELKLQMGEVLPNAIQIMAKSAGDVGLTVNGTVAEMLDLQQSGGLISSIVLPKFAANLQAAAKANDGLEKAMKSNRVAMNQLGFSSQMASKKIFENGWAKGLTVLFKSLTAVLQDNGLFLEEFGSLAGKVFKGLAWLIDNVVSPVMSSLGSILHGLNAAIEKFGGWVAAVLLPLAKFSPILGGIIKKFGGVNVVMKVLGFAFKRLLTPLYLILGVLEEVSEFFAPTGKKTLLGFNIDDMKDPFQKWLDTLDSIWEKLNMIFDQSSRDDGIGGRGNTSKVTPHGMPTMKTPKSTTQQVTLQAEVNLDGNKMGDIILSSESAKQKVQFYGSYAAGGNR